MPHANIWIRRENWDKWQALEGKAGFVNKHLEEALNIPKRVDLAYAADLQVEPCKHGFAPKFCKHARPGKPCK